jgi:ligand-binding sensor domain-containing protein
VETVYQHIYHIPFGMKRALFIGIFILIFILSCISSLAQKQTMLFDHLTSENGLPSSTINAILQDKNGFLWFATRNGLCKYDGYKFTVFKKKAKDDHSISDNWINTLFEDSEGTLYFSTVDYGFNIYDSKNENFIRYQVNQSGNSIGSDRIRCISEDSKGIIWIGTLDEGFYSFDKKRKKFTAFSLPPN